MARKRPRTKRPSSGARPTRAQLRVRKDIASFGEDGNAMIAYIRKIAERSKVQPWFTYLLASTENVSSARTQSAVACAKSPFEAAGAKARKSAAPHKMMNVILGPLANAAAAEAIEMKLKAGTRGVHSRRLKAYELFEFYQKKPAAFESWEGCPMWIFDVEVGAATDALNIVGLPSVAAAAAAEEEDEEEGEEEVEGEDEEEPQEEEEERVTRSPSKLENELDFGL